MCSTFETSFTKRSFEDVFGLPLSDEPEKTVVRPTDQALVMDKPTRLVCKKFGLSIDWSKQPLLNARSETLFEKASFADVVNQRCLVCASAYFEWRKEGAQKLKNRIYPESQMPFVMAGLYCADRFLIITRAASLDIRHIHGRMPVILSPAQHGLWLDQSIPSPEALNRLLDAPAPKLDWQEDTPDQLSLF